MRNFRACLSAQEKYSIQHCYTTEVAQSRRHFQGLELPIQNSWFEEAKSHVAALQDSLKFSVPLPLNVCPVHLRRNMSYEPRPIDTSKVNLSNDILEQKEKLAKHAHDIWAQERMKKGWRYGRDSDRARQEHPSLVPYEQPSESEKDFGPQNRAGDA